MNVQLIVTGATLAAAAAAVIEGIEVAVLISVLNKKLDEAGKLLMIVDKPDPSDTKQTEVRAEEPKPAKKKTTKGAPAPEPETVATAEQWEDFPAATENAATENAVIEGSDVPPDEVTTADVRAALDAFRVKHGLVTARTIMVEVGGSSKLVDINPSKYPALLAALTKFATPAKAA